MRYLYLVTLIMFQTSCVSRWITPKSVDNSPRQSDVIGVGDFKSIDKDKDGVISQSEFVAEKEKVLNEKNSGYLWAFLGIIAAVVMACCVPFVYMFTTKHVKLSWAKVATWKEKTKKEENESSTEV